MCKLFFFNSFIVITLFLTVKVNAQEFSNLYEDYSLSIDQKIKEQLFFSVETEEDIVTDNLIKEIDINRNKLIALLKLKQPELSHKIKSFDNGLKNDHEVLQILNTVIQELSIAGVVPNNNTIEEYSNSIGLNNHEANSLNFYIGYELFKKKNFKEAKLLFQKSITSQSIEKNYALFYHGLISIIESNFDDAHKMLLKIKDQNALGVHIPYYLCSSLYGMQRYDEIIRYYSPRQKERKLFNVDGIVELVALSNYHNNDYAAALKSIALLDQNDIKPMFIELHAIMNNVIGKYSETIRQLDKLDFSSLSDRSKFEKAIALGKNGDFTESNYVFNNLFNSTIPVDIINYNLAVNHSKLNQVEKSIDYANKVTGEQYQTGIRKIILSQITQINDPELISQLNQKSLLSDDSKKQLQKSLYNQGLKYYKSKDLIGLHSTLVTLDEVSPNSIENLLLRMASAIDNLSSDYTKANLIDLELFTKRLESLDTNNPLLIDANYHLGYYYFKEKNTSIALGYFTKSYSKIKNQGITDNELLSIESDLLARIGDSYIISEDYYRALETYTTLINNKRDNIDYALYQSALIHQIEGSQYDQIILLEDLVSKYPNSKYKFSSILKIAESYFALGQYDKSKHNYNTLLEQSEELNHKDIAHLQLGLINVNAGDYDKAESYYLKIINSSSNNEYIDIARNSLKEIYSDYNINTDALIKIASNDQKESPEKVLFNFSKNKFVQKNYTIALQEFNKLNKEFPNHQYQEDTEYYIIKIHRQEPINTVDKIIEYVNKHPSSPYNKELQTLLFNDLIASSQNSKFIELYRQNWFDHIESAVYSYIDVKIESNLIENIDKEIVTFAQSTKSKEEIAELTMKLFYTYASKNDWVEVLDISNKSGLKEYFIYNPKSIYHIALAEFNLEQTSKTIKYITDNYQRLIEDIGWLTKSVILLSDAYFITGDKELAIASLEGLLESDISIPIQLRTQAQERLDNLNL